MSTPLTNGDKSQSKFVSRATSYPVVSDSIEAVKANAYGKKAIEIADGAYQRIGPVVEPYLETPYSYAKPYVTKADELADAGLQKVDGQFPIVKEDTSTVIDTGKSYVFWPYNYVWGAYSDEYRKTANQDNASTGLVLLIKSVLSTELRIASDAFQLIADILGPKYQESKKKSSDYIRVGQEKGSEYLRQGQDVAEQYREIGQSKVDELGQKVDELTAQGKQKSEQVKGQAQQGAEQAKGQAEETKEQAKGQAQQGKETAKAKTGSK